MDGLTNLQPNSIGRISHHQVGGLNNLQPTGLISHQQKSIGLISQQPVGGLSNLQPTGLISHQRMTRVNHTHHSVNRLFVLINNLFPSLLLQIYQLALTNMVV